MKYSAQNPMQKNFVSEENVGGAQPEGTLLQTRLNYKCKARYSARTVIHTR